ncbi:hypothetical protein [Siansivirga zeaxanthinifaciens]|uniref:hypothetical protein n=1 Tax=Siansivirga zeaxanthinifaciens TaxID=762954 RepID=UPI000ACADE19|nr:hypothetical protein [Siansivirga zeaxanthinifaciens]
MFWDYTGVYGVGDVADDFYLKTLTLDYDFFDNEYFELSVINDSKIELYHPNSGTAYEFVGRGYIQFMKQTNTKTKSSATTDKLRKERKDKVENPRTSTRA